MTRHGSIWTSIFLLWEHSREGTSTSRHDSPTSQAIFALCGSVRTCQFWQWCAGCSTPNTGEDVESELVLIDRNDAQVTGCRGWHNASRRTRP